MYHMYGTVALFCLILLKSATGDSDGCNSKQVCIPAFQCPSTQVIHYRCGDESEDFKVCCPKSAMNQSTPTTQTTSTTQTSAMFENRIKEAFPDECGFFVTSDRISNGLNAMAGQFPWMALIGYKHPEFPDILFYCGGSIINSRYVLTAAHCLVIKGLSLELVRLGELDITKPIDGCEPNNTDTCADPPVDIPVEQIISHPKFNKPYFKNDIGLLRLKRKIVYSDYIRPICLPFPNSKWSAIDTKKKYTISGWGKTKGKDLGGSNVLQYALVSIWDMPKCNRVASPQTKPLSQESQICANGEKRQDACKGDSGGPLSDTVTDDKGEEAYYQIGIVSFAMGETCGNAELPSVYTRVSYFTKWIVENVKP